VAFFRCLADVWRSWIAVLLYRRLRDIVVVGVAAVDEYYVPVFLLEVVLFDEAGHGLFDY
jgi:hypothetical protein